MDYKILNTIGITFSNDAAKLLETVGEVEYATPPQAELHAHVADKHVVLVGIGVSVTREVIDAAPLLKIIATATTGLDHIDVAYAEEKGIKVLSLRGEDEFLSTITGTAELAFGLLLSLYRHIPEAQNEVLRSGEWNRERFIGHSVSGKKIGVLGMGRLGSIFGRIAEGFGAEVLFCDPNVEAETFPQYRKVSFEELITESDVVSIHVHLLPETTHLFNLDVFRQMKNSAYIINTSRGKVVHEADLVTALSAGTLAGYGADVLDGQLSFQGSASGHPLVEYARSNHNVLIVPHLGGMTVESRVATDNFIVEKILRALK